jgi:tetratricopeptide (TPR) repeat protein
LQTALYSKSSQQSRVINSPLTKKARAISVFIFCCIVSCAYGQTAKQYLSSGDEAMKNGQYYNAAQYYKQGLEKYEFNLEMEYKYAEALRGFNDYKTAADQYKKVIQEDVTHQYRLSVFWYGIMLHYLGKYEPAITQFRKFISRYSEKGYYHDKAQQEIESCSWAAAHIKDKETPAIKIIHLDEGVNTPYSESNPFEDPHRHFLFSSLRDQSKKKGKEKFLARIYESDSIYKTAKLFPIAGADPDKHIANGAYSPGWQRFYFTICEPAEDDKSLLRCDIYMSRTIRDSIAAPQKLPENINAPGYTATQPNIGFNEKDEQVLYFVSDRPGGYGKTDIWMSKIINDTSYQEPVNLGAQVNSIDEEFSPFYDNAEHKLYYASNWYYGFGGLDIFETTFTNGVWAAPKNIGHEVNSPQNDFYFYKSTDRSKNYFASNRKGSLSLKAETCCNDIWMYETGKKIETPEITAAVNVDTPVLTPPARDTSAGPVAVITSHNDTPHIFIDKAITKIKQMLPVTLYFHNDEPECCNLRDTTSLNYVETYQEYWALLAKYRAEFDKGLTGEQKSVADKEVFNLFTGKVEKGYYDLIQFTAQLLDILQSGKKMEVTIQGYCSPLNYSQYNIMLGYRRIASLRNYFYHYRDAILMPYVQSGQLVLKNESLGKETAPKNVSDNREDTRNSVYNPAAAIQRKVEVISVEIK